MSGQFENRYQRNMNTFTPEENRRMKDFKICVIGCGGLGGHIIEMLARLGVGQITAVDGDVFDETNLNRQLLSKESLIGKEKAMAAEDRIREVNREVRVNPVVDFVKENNCREIIRGHDLVIDALDNMSSRKIVAAGCREEGISLVHGAIAGWYGQVAVIRPEDRLLEKIYPDQEEKGAETELGNPSFTPALVASVQVAEAMKVLFRKGETLEGRMLVLDLLHHQYEVFEF
jgi:Dinucleotide-utilizing enzymes involved in molybdopterin and thiamine biosynthesis family 2